MPPWRLFLLLALGTALIASCGSDDEESRPGDPADEREVQAAIDRYHSALGNGNASEACDALTSRGRSDLETSEGSGSECEELDLFLNGQVPKRIDLPTIDPIGVQGDFGLAVIDLSIQGLSNLVYALREEEGEWKIDFGPVRSREELEEIAEEVDAGEVEEEVRVTAEEELDGRKEPDRITNVIVVGDIALAYLTAGRGRLVGGVSLFTRTANGWHASARELSVVPLAPAAGRP